MPKILIAEDSNVIQRMLKTVLDKENGFDIVGQAMNGEEAIAMNDSLSPDIVIMDYRMPKVSGVDAIKKIMSSKPVPILVFTSAEPEDKIQKEVMDLGAVGFMAKPKSMNYNEITPRLVMNIKTLSRMKPAKRTY